MNHPNVIKLHHAESDLDFRYCKMSLIRIMGVIIKAVGPNQLNSGIMLWSCAALH